MGNSDSAQLGYHVLQVSPNSPGEHAALIPFFDFILSANGTPLDKEDNRFATLLQQNLGKPIDLKVYNSKTETIRDTQLIPSDSWGGLGLGGISVRFCDYSKVMENVWHVLEVPESSPAAQAGLEAHTDYIVGSPEVVFNNENDFHNLLKSHLDKPLQLYIYSSLTDSVRLVTLVPSENWGGNGVLGCDVGFGLIHRIPTRSDTHDHAHQASQHMTHIEEQLQNLTMQSPIVPHGTDPNGSEGQIKDNSFQEIPLEELQELPQYYKQQVFQGQENSLQ
jgi:hypothetical protein